jgi:hypothetical protein
MSIRVGRRSAELCRKAPKTPENRAIALRLQDRRKLGWFFFVLSYVILVSPKLEL